MQPKSIIGILLFVVTTSLSCKDHVEATATPKKPNIIIILTDDQGYNDINYNNSKSMRLVTPNLARMAEDGVSLTNFYAAAPTCTASRAGLLTGRYPPRTGLTWVLFPGSDGGLDPKEETIPEILVANGYNTALFGKWHLGDHPGVLPMDQGFSEFYGIPYSNNLYPGWRNRTNDPPLPLYRNEEIIETNPDQKNFTKNFTQHSLDFMERNKDNPFFLMLAHPMPHVPLAVSEEFRGKSGHGLYADVIMEIDWSVGEIRKALKRLQIEDNTMVIFTSDNGPWLEYGTHAGSAQPLRNGKFSTFEGGQRVPCLITWPGMLPKGKGISQITSALDFLPTIARISHTELPKKELDGIDIWEVLAADKVLNREFYYFAGSKLEAVRQGDTKLHFPHRYREQYPGEGGEPGGFEWKTIDTTMFDLNSDIQEENGIPPNRSTLSTLLKKSDSLLKDISTSKDL